MSLKLLCFAERTPKNTHHLAWSWNDLIFCKTLHPNLDCCLKNALIFGEESEGLWAGARYSSASQHQWEERTNLWTAQTLLQAWNRGRCLQRLLCSWKQPQGGIRNVSVKASTGVRVAPLELWVCWQDRKTIFHQAGGETSELFPWQPAWWDLVLSSVIHIWLLSYFL